MSFPHTRSVTISVSIVAQDLDWDVLEAKFKQGFERAFQEALQGLEKHGRPLQGVTGQYGITTDVTRKGW
jgi:hypothetical protein